MMLYESSDSFLEENIDFDTSKYIVVPVPFDMTTTYLKGTKFGPRSVIEASRSLENYDAEMDYDLRNKIFTIGELELPPDVDKSVAVISQTVSDILSEGKVPVLIGGEHTCTYAASKSFDDDVNFVIFDAHADFKENVLGVGINHASNSRLISEKKPVTIIGVRSLSSEDKSALEKSRVNVIYFADIGNEDKNKKIISKLKGKRVYISIDMDVFDPAFAPGVGTPQPNGMDYKTMFAYLKRIVDSGQLVGLDVNEVRPLGDNNITEILASKLIIDIISMNEAKK